MAMTRAKASQITTKLGSTGTVRGLDDKLAEMVSAEDFGAVGDGVADDTVAIQKAINDEIPFCFTPGKNYRITSGISASNKAVCILGNGATVFLDAAATNTSLFSLVYEYTNVTALTGYGTTTINFGGGATPCQRLTVALGASLLSVLVPGDVVKVVSDQFIPSSPLADNERLGEQAFVAAVNAGAGTIDLLGVLNESFVLAGNNVRVAKATQKEIVIDDLRVTIAPSSNGRSAPLLYVQGAVNPKIRFEAFSARSPGLELQSTFMADVDALASDLVTTDSANEYGYGVVSYAGVGGRYRVKADRVRHAWTEGARGVLTANSVDIHRYGGSIRENVDIDAHACYGAGADTHPSALGTRLRGYVDSSLPGDNTSNTCVQLRGRGEDVDVTTAGLRAVRVSMIGSGGGQRIRINHTRPVGYGSTLSAVTIEGDATNPGGQVDIEFACRAEGDTFAGIEVLGGAVVRAKVRDFDHACTDTGSTRPRLFDISGASLVLCSEFDLNYSRRTGTLSPAVVRCDGTSSFDLSGGKVKIGSGTWFIADMRSGAGTGRISFDSDIVSSNITNAGTSVVSPNVSTAGASVLGSTSVRTSANASFTVSVLSPRTYYLNEAIGSARTVTESTSGFFEGSEIHFVRGASATGAFNWNIGGDALTGPSTWLIRKLVGGSWITIAKGTL